MAWDKNQKAVKMLARDYLKNSHQAEFYSNKVDSDKLESIKELQDGRLHVKWSGSVKKEHGLSRDIQGVRGTWDFYFDINADGSVSSPRLACMKHKKYVNKVCTNCKQAVCGDCQTYEFDEPNLKTAGICRECYTDLVKKKTRGFMYSLVFGVVFGIAGLIWMGGILGLIFGLFVPYMIRYCQFIFAKKAAIWEFIGFLAVVCGAATVVFPVFQMIREARLRMAQKALIESFK